MSDKKSTSKKPTKAEAKAKKPKATMREASAKTREKVAKQKRVRRAASAASKPLSKAGTTMIKQRHVLPKSGTDSFWHRERSLVPRYIHNSWLELKKVTWPGRKETWKLVFAVFAFAIFLGIFISVSDYLFERLLKDIIL